MFARENPLCPLLQPDQVHQFAENYFNYMDKEVDEISELKQKRIKSRIKQIADELSIKTKATSMYVSESHQVDLGFNKKIEGPLKGPEKLDFLMTVRCNIIEFLTLNTLSDCMRRYHAALLCIYSEINPDVYRSWIYN